VGLREAALRANAGGLMGNKTAVSAANGNIIEQVSCAFLIAISLLEAGIYFLKAEVQVRCQYMVPFSSY
jgi:hypothetical protein